MRFTATTTGPFPGPASPAIAAYSMGTVIEAGVQRGQYRGASGTSGILIKGENRRFTIILHNLIISWNNVKVLGRIEIHTPTSPELPILQSGSGGHLVIPCNDESIFLGRYGLRTVCNSVEGEYAVVAFYTIKEA